MFIILVFTSQGVQIYSGEPCDNLLLSTNFGQAVFFNDYTFSLKLCENLKKCYSKTVLEAFPFSFNNLSLLLASMSLAIEEE